jgi:elongation factor G
MDRTGADFFGVIQQMQERLGANAVPMQIPIGAEEDFKGIIDLIERRAIVWIEDEEMGMKYEYTEIPEDLVDTVEEWREKLVEAVCETDDSLLEKFFEDRDSISVDEFMEYTRRAVISRILLL